MGRSCQYFKDIKHAYVKKDKHMKHHWKNREPMIMQMSSKMKKKVKLELILHIWVPKEDEIKKK